jgi:amino acid permease
MTPRAKLIEKSALTVLGTIIGAGLFGLPAMFSRVGFWPGTVLFWILAFTVLLTHLLLVEVILATPERMRLSGFARKWIGNWAFYLSSVTYPFQVIGVNFIYILLGGQFLAAMAQLLGIGGSVFFWQVAFWVGGAATVFVGLKLVSKVEAFATWLLIGSLATSALILAWTHPMQGRVLLGDGSFVLVPFGIFLFSLSGMNVIGEAVDIVLRDRRSARVAVVVGTLGAAFLAWMFGVVAAVAANGHLGNKANDLLYLFPPGWVWLVPVVGFLAIATSYITTAQDLKASFALDYRFPKPVAWAVALGMPMLIFLISAQDFLRALDIIGTFFTGFNGMLAALIGLCVARMKHGSWRMVAAGYLVFSVFAFGMLQRYFLQ